MLLVLFGLPCGLVAGLTGIGASVVVQPLLRFLLGLRDVRLIGTTLAVTFFAALSAVLAYAQHGYVRWVLAVVLVLGQTIGAIWGQRLLASRPALARAQWLWAAIVVAVGLAMCWDGLRGAPGAHGRAFAFGLPVASSHRLVVGLGLAMLVGVLSRVMGLGAVLILPAAIYGLGLTPQAAQGTAIVALVLASLPGLLARAGRGEVEPQASTWMSVGAILGGLVGAFYAVSPGLTAAHLTLIDGIVITLLGASLLWRTEAAG